MLFRPDQLRRLLVVELPSGDTLDLRFGAAERSSIRREPSGLITVIFYSFEQEAGEKPLPPSGELLPVFLDADDDCEITFVCLCRDPRQFVDIRFNNRSFLRGR